MFKPEWYVEGLRALNNTKTSITDKTVFIDTSLSSSFEVYSLEGDVYSSRNNKMILEHNNDYSPFEYDKDEDKLVYSSYKYKESFIYLEPKITNVGVVSFDFKVDSYSDYSSLSSDDKNDIFTLNGRHIFSSPTLKMFISNNNLIFYHDGQYTNLGTFTNYDIWNKLTLILYPGTNRCSLYLNYELLFSSTSLRFAANERLYLGSQMNVKDTQFGGQIKNVLVSSNAYSTAAKQHDLVESLLTHSNKFVKNTYNQLNMLVNRNVSNRINKTYTYNKTKLTKETSEYFENNYTFNDIGNLTKLTTLDVNGSSSHQYVYDSSNRLCIVVNSDSNKREQITLNYDNNGNIRTRIVNNITTGVTTGRTFTYDSSNRLTGMYDSENEYVLQYNGISPNPSLLRKNNVPYHIFYEGKRIIRINNNQYFYNEEGIRTRKVIVNNTNGAVTTETHDYILEGNKIIKEIVYGDSRNYVLNFDYDMHGELIGFEYNENYYFYVRDALGNINHIIDSNGNVMVSYKYDEWGKLIDTITTSTFALILSGMNPFIYKGYYYDVETQLFYCNSRYYSPELCRWISPDSIEYLDPSSINGLNLYCYCMNNPIMYYDPSGHWIESVFDILSICYDIYCLSTNDGHKDWKNWAVLGLDVACLILPIATGGSAIVRTADMANTIDNAGDLTKIYGHIDGFADAGGIIRRADELDFVDDGWKLVHGLNKTSDGFTVSNRFIGTDIHTKFKYGSRVIDIHNRVDGIDDALRLVYELKPYNKRSIRQGIKQLYRYQKAIYKKTGVMYDMILVVY